MEIVSQTLEEILDNLRPIEVDWRDPTARSIIEQLRSFPVKDQYADVDIAALLDRNFEEGKLICRLFLGRSKDEFESLLIEALGKGGTGFRRYQAEPEVYLAALNSLGLHEAIWKETHRKLHWTDALVERLRSGRGSAISGQRPRADCRGLLPSPSWRKCSVTPSMRGAPSPARGAKPPSVTSPFRAAQPLGSSLSPKDTARPVSKMTDVLGDIKAIIEAKRSDTAFLFFTDGVSWRQRQSDLRKIVEHQNNGDITRIYTYAMAHALRVRPAATQGRVQTVNGHTVVILSNLEKG